jgi:PEP-CTERM motif
VNFILQLRTYVIHVAILGVIALFVSPAAAVVVVAPDNGFGTATIPPTGETYFGTQMQIIDGLPFGSTVDINNPLFHNFSSVQDYEVAPPDSVNYSDGNFSNYDAQLTLGMTGTGAFSSYNRTIVLPLPAGPLSQVMHFDGRVTNAPLQVITADLRRLQGQITIDPDFDLLRITAGTDFGLPSPGTTTLLDQGSTYNVDSFFDVIYRIDFVGRAGGTFSGMSGSTTSTARFHLGELIVPEPSMLGLAGIAAAAAMALRRRSARSTSPL